MKVNTFGLSHLMVASHADHLGTTLEKSPTRIFEMISYGMWLSFLKFPSLCGN